MLEDIIFLKDEMAQLVCAAWAHSQDPKEIANMTKIDRGVVVREIARLQKLNILQKDGKLDDDAARFIKTVAAVMIKGIKG